MNGESRGQIITFYSYKGGTGRTMTLANIACILAKRQSERNGKEVLMIDWDLEAPGLHRYFRKRPLSSSLDDPQDSEKGLIDLFYELEKNTDGYLDKQRKNEEERPLRHEDLARAAIKDIDIEKTYVLPTTVTGLRLLKAGSFNSKNPHEYSERVNRFNWESLYHKSPELIRILAETLAEKYEYVLIDSRTGVSDISGICTTLLPEKLVVVFTPNLQSLKGGIDLIRSATDYRKESADLRPLRVFPLVSRVEANEPDLRHNWRFGSQTYDTPGYQTELEKVLAAVYNRGKVRLTNYFDEIQIQHIPRYAYGEEIAFLTEKTDDKFSLRRSYQTFARKLIEDHMPWEGEIKEEDFIKPGARHYAQPIVWLKEALRSRRVRRAFAVASVLVASALALLLLTAYVSYYKGQKVAAERQIALQKVVGDTRIGNQILESPTETYEKAIAGFDKFIEQNPQVAEAFDLRGNAYTNLGKYDRAIQDYQRAIELKSDYAEAWIDLGTAYRLKGDRGETNNYNLAIDAYSRAIKLQPDLADAYFGRAETYRALGDKGSKNSYDLALADYNRLVTQLKRGTADVLFKRGLTHKAKGNNNAALTDFQKALELPSDDVLRENVKNNLQELKTTSQAQQAAMQPKIFIQYNDPDDEEVVYQIAEDLTDSGYRVVGTPQVSAGKTTGDVRSFNITDFDNEKKIAQVVQTSLARQGYARPIEARPPLGGYPNVPLGTIEVWIPSLKIAPEPTPESTGRAALCRDGTFSSSSDPRAVCRGRGGIAQWIR